MGSKIGDLRVDSKFDILKNGLVSLLDNLEKECVNQVVSISTGKGAFNDASLGVILSDIDMLITNNPVVRQARVDNNPELLAIIQRVNLEVHERMDQLTMNLRNDGDKSKVTRLKDFHDSNSTNKTQKDLQDFDTDSTMTVGSTTERQTSAATKKAELTQRIAVAKKLDETIKSTTPPITKDDIVDSIKDANSDMKKVTKKMNNSEHLMDENSMNLLIGEVETKARQVSFGKGAYSADDYKKIQTLLDELEKYNTPKTLALKAKIEATVQRNSDGKIEKVNDVITLKRDTKNSLTGPATIDFADEMAENKKITISNVRSELLDMLRTKGIFKFYSNETKGFETEINDPTTTPERITAIKEIMQNLLDQAIDQDLESQLDQADIDRADISALEAQKLRAELTETKLNDVNRRHNTLSTTSRNAFGVELQLLDEHGNPKDISQIAGTDQELESLYDNLETKLSDEQIKNTFNANAPAVYKPNLFQRALWKLTHPSSWGKKYGLAEIRMDQWVKAEIGRSVAEIKSDATDKAWTIQPDELRDINTRSREIAEKAKKKQREAIIDGTKGAKDASKDAKTEIDQEQENEDMIL